MRVIVYCREYLLASAIESLLVTEKEDLILLVFAKSKKDLNRTFAKFKPDVIITDDESLLDAKFEFHGLLKRQMGLKILVLNREQNLINSFVCQKIPITGTADLLQAVYS